MKKYGIRITLPEDDPMRAPHLLGPDWEGFRWYDSEAERDDAYREVNAPLAWNRRGDHPSQIVEKVERD